MNRDVFLSILALDSYNRGYGANLVIPGVSAGLGLATVLRQSNIFENSAEVAAGFYAIAYDVSNVSGFLPGDRVMSYRGTSISPS
jgi:hypothetical protein